MFVNCSFWGISHSYNCTNITTQASIFYDRQIITRRPSFNTRDPMQGRAAAGAVRGLQPSILGRSHAAHAICARFAWTGTSAPRAWCCCCVLACHHARAGACCSRPSRAPSVRTDGPTGRPGECCANGWCTCMDRALRTARHGAASGVRAYATMRARCSNARGGALAHRCKMG